MKQFVIFAGLIAMAQGGSAAPCGQGTLASYILLGAGGCTIQGAVFSSFQALTPITGATLAAPENITISPIDSPGNLGFTIQMSAFALANSIREARFRYQISAGGITQSSITLSNTASSGDGAIYLIQDYCVNGTFGQDGVSGCTGLPGRQLSLNSGLSQATFGSGSLLSVTNDFTLDGGQNGSASGGTITNQFVASGQVCSYSVSPGSQTVTSALSNQVQTVTAGAGCSWLAFSNAFWIAITSPSSGTGNGTVTYQVLANPGTTSRTGTLTIAGQVITITQNGPISSTSAFVTSLYQDLLNRAPDPNGLNFYINLIDSGTLNRSQVAAQLFTSPEFSSGGLYVIKLYIALLKRDPDFTGWKFWFNSLQTGTPAISVLTSFLTSPEFQQLYGNTDNTAFVTLVYFNILGRQPDPVGLAYYVNLLNTGQLPRANLVYQFVQSPEYNASIRARAYANLLYMGFLRRGGDPTGLAYWTGVLGDSNALPGAITGFITSPEYLGRF